MKKILITICLLILMSGCTCDTYLYRPNTTLEQAEYDYNETFMSMKRTGPMFRTARTEVRIFNSVMADLGYKNITFCWDDLPPNIRLSQMPYIRVAGE